MSKEVTPVTKWRDSEGNTYAVDKAVRNGRFVVIRTNMGGHRKGAKQFSVAGNACAVQKVLNAHAKAEGWQEVPTC